MSVRLQDYAGPEGVFMSDLALDPRRTALVVIDLQKGILQFPMAPHAMETVVANSAQLVAQARQAGTLTVLVHVGFSPDFADFLKPASDEQARMSGGMPADWTNFAPELNRQPSDIVILKRQWGAFYGTELDLQLRRRGISTLILCGVATEVGVESTARDAFERGYEQIFAEDAMSARTAESHTHTTTRIFPRIGRVRRTEDIVAAFGAGGSGA
jgi:nicotinamidase-related amidase